MPTASSALPRRRPPRGDRPDGSHGCTRSRSPSSHALPRVRGRVARSLDGDVASPKSPDRPPFGRLEHSPVTQRQGTPMSIAFIFAFVLLFILLTGIRIAQEYQRGVVFRLGRYV